MAKWHVNPDTKEPGVCRAVQRCRYDGQSEHYDTLEEANTVAAVLRGDLQVPSYGRKTILNSRESLKRNLEEFFNSIMGSPIPTRLQSSYLDFNLADVKGRTLEALMTKYFDEANIQVRKEPNGPDTFPDYEVKTRENGWVPLELKEESMDSARRGKTNQRIMRLGAVIDSLANGRELFEAVFLTASKTSDESTVTFHDVNFEAFLEMTGPTKAREGKPSRVIGYDTNTKNLVRSAGSFNSEREAVEAILSLYEEFKDDAWHDKKDQIAIIRDKYKLDSPPPVLLPEPADPTLF